MMSIRLAHPVEGSKPRFFPRLTTLQVKLFSIFLTPVFLAVAADPEAIRPCACGNK